MESFSCFGVGLLLIIIGFLVGKYPKLLAQYYFGPNEKRGEVDWKGVGRMARKWLIGMGVFQLFGVSLLRELGTWELIAAFDLILVMAGSIIIIVKSQKYNL